MTEIIAHIVLVAIAMCIWLVYCYEEGLLYYYLFDMMNKSFYKRVYRHLFNGSLFLIVFGTATLLVLIF